MDGPIERAIDRAASKRTPAACGSGGAPFPRAAAQSTSRCCGIASPLDSCIAANPHRYGFTRSPSETRPWGGNGVAEGRRSFFSKVPRSSSAPVGQREYRERFFLWLAFRRKIGEAEILVSDLCECRPPLLIGGCFHVCRHGPHATISAVISDCSDCSVHCFLHCFPIVVAPPAFLSSAQGLAL
jgi:hypothetical protein